MSMRTRTIVRSLILASHPLPTAAVTVLMAALVTAAGNDVRTSVLTILAVLTGQLSIGWSNDAIDAVRDGNVGRSDKPVATGAVARRLVWQVALGAATTTVALSLVLGWRSGSMQLIVVVSGWLYNVRLKSTVLSPLPFAVAFGALPAVATLALPSHRLPPGWVLVAGALIGVAAHFGNVLPDLDDDLRTGVVGMPHRIGRMGCTLAATACGVAATLVVALSAHAPQAWVRALLTAVAVACAGVALVAVRQGSRSRAAFHATMAIAAVDVALLATSHALV